MKKGLLFFVCFLIISSANAQFVKEYVRSFSLKNSDTILFKLHIPYEIIEWDKNIVRTFTQIESFSLGDEILKKLSKQGRYSMVGERKNGLLEISMPDLFHHVQVQGVMLTDEVVAQIYVPKDFPILVVCETKSPDEQLQDLWMQQEIITRKINYPIRKGINTEFFAAVEFKEGKIIEAKEINGTKRFLELKVLSNGKEYRLVSRLDKLFNPEDLINQEVVFVAHDFTPELKKLPNEGMVLVHENKKGELVLLNKTDIPDYLFVQ